MIDDIEDNSKLRRGVPVAHSIFGIPTVINGANYAYFLALEKCHALKSSEAMNVFVGELLNLHRGQGQDILVRKSQWFVLGTRRSLSYCDSCDDLFCCIIENSGEMT